VAEPRDHTDEIDGLPVFWRSADAETADAATPVYVHGVPTNSDDWLPFLAPTGGVAPDLPGFGRSGKPGSLRYDIDEYDAFIERFLDHLGIERASLVVHDWGGVALAFAQRVPERVERLVIINTVPFLPGYRWHRTAKIWRTPVAGELFMGTINRRTLRLGMRDAAPVDERFLSSIVDHFDHGTQRAILRLYRSAPEDVLERAGARLSHLQMPALVIWGKRDPYIPPRFGADWARALPHAELVELEDAGHWPWLDRPDVIERVSAFLRQPPG
jgi:pimeloyl-ACP methyl ester carboxylesterase